MAIEETDKKDGDAISPAPSGTSSDFYALYEEKEILGTGMSSVVRRCVEKKTGNEFAVKIVDVSTEKFTEEQATELRRTVLEEIRVQEMVSNHPNIVSLHDFFETSTFVFIVFELCQGGELFDYLTRVVCCSEKKTRQVMRQLLQAVHTLHSKRVVHRDLKPENILMVSDDLIKLTDFGFAAQLAPGEKLKELVGTPGYLAPEVLRTSMYEDMDGYGLEVDLWASGVIMYTLLCGYAPFYHRKQIYMLRSIAEGKYEFRSPEWDEINPTAKDLISKLLVTNPEERLTVEQALAHSFFAAGAPFDFLEIAKKFDAKKKFRLAIVQVRSLIRLLNIKLIPVPITAYAARRNPYALRKIRKHIDACAFQVYGHWVKKGREAQYRDVLFANEPKDVTVTVAL